MSPEQLEIDVSATGDPPAAVLDWVRVVEARIDDFFETEANRRYPLYLPSDAMGFYHTLKTVTDSGLPEGKVFCEWGSGFGLHAGLAALLGYEAHGIEIEPELNGFARELAAEHGLDVSYHETSYVPEGFDTADGLGGTDLLLPPGFRQGDHQGGGPCYEGTDLCTTDIDVFYVYPRPDDQEFMLDLFENTAEQGALLITWFGVGQPLVFRAGD